jgi:hypothetical protein
VAPSSIHDKFYSEGLRRALTGEDMEQIVDDFVAVLLHSSSPSRDVAAIRTSDIPNNSTSMWRLLKNEIRAGDYIEGRTQ